MGDDLLNEDTDSISFCMRGIHTMSPSASVKPLWDFNRDAFKTGGQRWLCKATIPETSQANLQGRLLGLLAGDVKGLDLEH